MYTASLYWAITSITSITSVGYGDILPTSPGEMRLATFALLSGGILWAYIIGSACGIISTLDVAMIEHRQRMDQLNYMMADQRIPAPMRQRLRAYFQAMRTMLKNDSYTALILQMSPQLQSEVSVQKSECLRTVSYLSVCGEKFVVAVTTRLSDTLYTPQESINFADSLMIVSRGVASRDGRVKTPGNTWGDDFILRNLELKDRAPSFALTYVDILSLARESFYRILDNPNFGRERGIVRRACAYMSFRLGVLRVTRLVRDGDTRAVDFLLDAHDAADGGAESAGAGGGAALSASGLQQRRQSVKDIKRLLSGADGDAGGGGAAGEPELPGARSSFDGCNPRELFGRDSRKSADRARGARGSRDDAELGAKVEAMSRHVDRIDGRIAVILGLLELDAPGGAGAAPKLAARPRAAAAPRRRRPRRRDARGARVEHLHHEPRARRGARRAARAERPGAPAALDAAAALDRARRARPTRTRGRRAVRRRRAARRVRARDEGKVNPYIHTHTRAWSRRARTRRRTRARKRAGWRYLETGYPRPSGAQHGHSRSWPAMRPLTISSRRRRSSIRRSPLELAGNERGTTPRPRDGMGPDGAPLSFRPGTGPESGPPSAFNLPLSSETASDTASRVTSSSGQKTLATSREPAANSTSTSVSIGTHPGSEHCTSATDVDSTPSSDCSTDSRAQHVTRCCAAARGALRAMFEGSNFMGPGAVEVEAPGAAFAWRAAQRQFGIHHW